MWLAFTCVSSNLMGEVEQVFIKIPKASPQTCMSQLYVGVYNWVLIETFTVLWMVVEAAVSLGAGVLARSALLVAFGIDSVIELVSGAILLWPTP
jgi:hypothetical protein